MKTTLALIALLICSVGAQTPPPATPAPFDALHAAPPATPAPVALTLAQQQAKFHNEIAMRSKFMLVALIQQYNQMLEALTKDDSAKGGLTPAQKQAAMSPAELLELNTNAWLLANLINGIKPGTVVNPPAQ